MSTLSVGTIQSNTTSPPTITNSNGTEIGTFCRAWVNFNGTGTVAIRASFNVSSITDNGTGDYTVNFTTAMSDANYNCCITISNNASGTSIAQIRSATTPTTTAIRLASVNASGTALDPDYVNASIFR